MTQVKNMTAHWDAVAEDDAFRHLEILQHARDFVGPLKPVEAMNFHEYQLEYRKTHPEIHTQQPLNYPR